MPSQLLDTGERLLTLITEISHRLTQRQLIFIGIEGVDLVRRGPVAIMQMLLPPDPMVYLIDVLVLGREAFTIGDENGNNLQSVLESTSVPKVFFDVRNHSDALFHHFQIKLQCVVDLQIIEFAIRDAPGRYLKGLVKCLAETSASLPLRSHDWYRKQEAGRRFFDPRKGGSHDVFLRRPLPEAIIEYCERDVLLLPSLLSIYTKRLKKGIAMQLPQITIGRVARTHTAKFNGQGRQITIGPIIKNPV